MNHWFAIIIVPYHDLFFLQLMDGRKNTIYFTIALAHKYTSYSLSPAVPYVVIYLLESMPHPHAQRDNKGRALARWCVLCAPPARSCQTCTRAAENTLAMYLVVKNYRTHVPPLIMCSHHVITRVQSKTVTACARKHRKWTLFAHAILFTNLCAIHREFVLLNMLFKWT